MKFQGSQLLVESLIREGVKSIFSLPGIHILPIYDALYDHPEIHNISVRHELSSAYMAEAYSRVTGKPGVCLTTAGPGLTNALTGIAEAYLNSSPIIIISGGVSSAHLGKGAIHEVDQMAIVRPVTKWCARAHRPEDIPCLVHKAFHEALTGRPRPCYLELPLDILSGRVELQGSPEELVEARKTVEGVDGEVLRGLMESLKRSERPVIIAGGGVVRAGATAQLLELAELLSIPVATTLMGKGSIPEDHPLSLGMIFGDVGSQALSEADLALVIGARLSERSTKAWKLVLPPEIFQIDVDPEVIGRNYPVRLGIVGDAGAILTSLLEKAKKEGMEASKEERPWTASLTHLKEELEKAKQKAMSSDQVPIKPQRVMKELREVLARDAIVTVDTGNNTWWALNYLEIYKPASFLLAAGYVSMGYALPAAIAAKLAHSDREVVAICGDGGFVMMCPELATAVENRIPLLVIVLNDKGYGAIRHYQRFNYQERYTAVDLEQPDIPRLAEAFGAVGIRVDDPKQLGSTLRSGIEREEVVVVDVQIDKEEVILPPALIERFKGRAK